MNKLNEQPEAYYELISSCPLFSGQTRDEVLKSLRLLDYRFASYSKNEYLIRCGEDFKRFGLVLSGRIKVMIDDIEGNTAIMAEVTPGITFGESLCFLGSDSGGVCVSAAEDAKILWLCPDALFRGHVSPLHQRLERSFTQMLALRTLAMNSRIQILSRISLREKILTFLTFAGKEPREKRIDISLSREEMAIYLGTNRSALSRELSRMKKDGLIDFHHNHFTVLF